MVKPKIRIEKKRILRDGKHYRFYHYGTYSLDKDNTFSEHTGKHYTLVLVNGRTIKTERQLVIWILNMFGYGEYRVSAHAKGRRGQYRFWEGSITPDGWTFYPRNNTNKEIKKLSKEMFKARNQGDEEEMRYIKEDIDFEREINKENIKTKRYGFHPFLRRSGLRGQMHRWNEPDEGLMSTHKIIDYPEEKEEEVVNW